MDIDGVEFICDMLKINTTLTNINVGCKFKFKFFNFLIILFLI